MSLVQRAKKLATHRYDPKRSQTTDKHKAQMNAYVMGYCDAMEAQQQEYISSLESCADLVGIPEDSDIRKLIQMIKDKL